VFAAAVVLPRRVPSSLAGLLDDSKKLTPEEREEAFAALLKAHKAGKVEIGVGAASVAEIVRINILRAALLAITRSQ
jgi:ribonuclease HII